MEIVSPNKKIRNEVCVSFDDIAFGEVFIDYHDETVYIKTDDLSAVVVVTNIDHVAGELYDGNRFLNESLVIIKDAKLQTAYFDNE